MILLVESVFLLVEKCRKVGAQMCQFARVVSKGLRSGRNVFVLVGSNPTADILLRHTTPKTTKRRKTTQDKTHAPPYNDYGCPAPLLPRLETILYTQPSPHTNTVICDYALHSLYSNRLRQQSPLSTPSPSSLVSKYSLPNTLPTYCRMAYITAY